jgi:hypothetical protein
MRYVIASLWAIPATASAYLVSGIFFGYSLDDWVLILMFHAIATWMGIYISPPCYKRWFTREK